MKRTIALLAALALSAAFSAEAAAPCRDAKGKFIKCPPPAAAAKLSATSAKPGGAMMARCRDAKGAFAKCGTPGAKPAGAK